MDFEIGLYSFPFIKMGKKKGPATSATYAASFTIFAELRLLMIHLSMARSLDLYITSDFLK